MSDIDRQEGGEREEEGGREGKGERERDREHSQMVLNGIMNPPGNEGYVEYGAAVC